MAPNVTSAVLPIGGVTNVPKCVPPPQMKARPVNDLTWQKRGQTTSARISIVAEAAGVTMGSAIVPLDTLAKDVSRNVKMIHGE